MLKNITITFDELERRLFDTVASPSILGGPEEDAKGPYPRTRLVRRAAQGEALTGLELAALKRSLEEATAERERYDDPARPWPSVMKIARQLAVLARAGHCERRFGAISSYRIRDAA